MTYSSLGTIWFIPSTVQGNMKLSLKHECATASLEYMQLADYPDYPLLRARSKPKIVKEMLLFWKLLHLRCPCEHAHKNTCRVIYGGEVAFLLWPL